jgi:hypothetical protein
MATTKKHTTTARSTTAAKRTIAAKRASSAKRASPAKPASMVNVRSASNGAAPIRARARREKVVPAHLEVGDDGWTVIVPERPIAPLTVEQTRAAIDLVRR